ncbi:hypothetical protein BQ8482_180236 [Mesorhizobium delmotii]|uniref:Uncharacterized protein n=1 Tax=Mesorhizobium delmotii TaxID=1631247 RepID=A0A2P9AIQ9_9HYPH|nr:hypothetical protein BQ8482_180236 [Mesorhizobium delmotii]
MRQKAVMTCEWDGFERLIENVAAAPKGHRPHARQHLTKSCTLRSSRRAPLNAPVGALRVFWGPP